MVHPCEARSQGVVLYRTPPKPSLLFVESEKFFELRGREVASKCLPPAEFDVKGFAVRPYFLCNRDASFRQRFCVVEVVEVERPVLALRDFGHASPEVFLRTNT